MKLEAKLTDCVAERMKALYIKLHGLEVAEILIEAWESKRNFKDDPVFPKYQFKTSSSEKEISASKMYDIIWSVVDSDWHLWELTQATEPLLKRSWQRKTGKPYPFDNAVELFLVALEEREAYGLSQRDRAIGGKGYYYASPRNVEKFMDEAEKLLTWQLSPSEKRKIEKSVIKRFSNTFSVNYSESALKAHCPHYSLLLLTAIKSKNETVKRRFSTWQNCQIESFKLQKPILHKLKNLSLNNGKIQGDQLEFTCYD